MLRSQKTILTVAIVFSLGLAAFAKNSKLTGKIVAYDLMRHEAKAASGVQNEEVVVARDHRAEAQVCEDRSRAQLQLKLTRNILPGPCL